MIEFIVDLLSGMSDIVSPCAYDRAVFCLSVGFPLLTYCGIMYCFTKLLKSLLGGKL